MVEEKGYLNILGMFPAKYCKLDNGTDTTAIIWLESMMYTIKKANDDFKKIIFGYTIYGTDGYAYLNGTTDAAIGTIFNTKTF